MTQPGTPARENLLRLLHCSTSGVAVVEFALALPILIAVGMLGLETAHLAVVNMRISQVAAHIADNASRIGDGSLLENRRIYESDIIDVLQGADIQAGSEIDLYTHGRVVISSLQYDDETSSQFIKWQRCLGDKAFVSAYGGEGTGLDGTLLGMGPAGEVVTAMSGEPVIFVEVAYDYQPLITNALAPNRVIRAEASFLVRDDRDTTQIYQRNATSPDPVLTCA